MAGKLETQLDKKPGFDSYQQAAVIGLMSTYDQFHYRQARFFRDHGLTQPQYNILRILRGEGAPLPCLEIADRMITTVPGITRLIDTLEERDLVLRERDDRDRRICNVSLTGAGRRLLESLDEPVLDHERTLCRGLTKAECLQLTQLLEKAREGLAARK